MWRAVKVVDLQWVQLPPGTWVAPAGSYQSGGGGNEAAGAFETTGDYSRSASGQAITRVNVEQASKRRDVGADPAALRGRPTSLGNGGGERSASRAIKPSGPTGVVTMACPYTEILRNTGNPRPPGRVTPTGNPRGPGRAAWGGGQARSTDDAG